MVERVLTTREETRQAIEALLRGEKEEWAYGDD